MYYLVAVCASVCFSLQFVCMKFYQKHVKNNILTSLVFSAVTAAINLLILLVMIKFRLHLTTFSLLIALAMALVSTFSVIVGIKVMKYGKLSVYSMFMMLGGMALPFVFGLFWMDEKFSAMKGVAMVIMVAALLLSARDKKEGDETAKSSWVFYIMCLIIFVLNGSVSILSSVQARGSEKFGQAIVGTFDFTIWVRIFTIAFSALFVPMALVKESETRKAELLTVKDIFHLKPIIGLVAFSVISLTGFLLSMTCAEKLDASVLYPITTGGTIVLSAIWGLAFYREKISVYMIVCLVLTSAATVMFMF